MNETMTTAGCAALADSLVGWAREQGDVWFTPEQAAAALGADESFVREVLADLEDAGLVWRSISERGKFRLTADAEPKETELS